MTNKFIRFWNVVMLFIPAYFILGVIYPTKVAFINNITMSYIYVIGYFILNNFLMAALAVRGLFV